MNHTVLLTTTYCGPVQWYQKLFRYDHVLLEQHEHFVKQSYRNRCLIATTNGIQALTIPLERNDNNNSGIRDVRISDHGNWRHLHWHALMTAYGDSPFFEYYADDLRPFYEKKWDYLFDFNLEITHTLCGLLDIQPDLRMTDTFRIPVTDTPLSDADDFRYAIQPKHPLPDSTFEPRTYYQVYARKHGFLPNLSVLDLLFNMGNESILYL